MANEVVIIVKTEDKTKAGFDAAKGSASNFLEGMGKVGLAVGGVLLGVGVEATKMASNFQSEMEKLVTQAGVSQGKMEVLKSGVLDLAGKVGFSPDSLAESLYHVASNMQSTGASSKQMMDVLTIAAQGAKVGGADLVDVTNALTAAVVSGIPGVENYSKAMGILNATVGTGDMTMQNLADAFGTGAVAVVKGFGLNITDVGAALAVFGDNNIRGAAAGTQLRMTVQGLAAPTAAGAKVLERMGLSANSLAKDMQSGGLLKALEDLKEHMTAAGITADQQGQIITEIFGKKSGTGINILSDQLDRLKGKYEELGKGASGFGDAWAKTQQTVKQQWDELKASLDAIMIRIGSALLPVLSKILAWAMVELPKVGDLLKKAFESPLIQSSLKSIREDAEKVVEQIKAHWPQIKEIVGIVGGVLYAVVVVVLKIIDAVLKLDTIMVQVWAKIIDVVNIAALGITKAIVAILTPIAKVASALHLPFAKGMQEALDSVRGFSDKIQDQINSIHGKSVTVTVTQQFQTVGSSVYNQQVPYAARASGGIVGAASGAIRSGLTMVGEHGAELVDLPAGSHVFSNPDSGRMLSGAGSGRSSTQTTVDFTGNMDQMFATFFMRAQRQGLIQIRSTSIVS